jgi:hypothetical protein
MNKHPYTHVFLLLMLSLLAGAGAAECCDDFYLEWKHLESFAEEPVPDGFLGISEAVAKLKTALRVEQNMQNDWPHKLKIAFVGWGPAEQPANADQIDAVKEAFELFFPLKMLHIEPDKMVSAPGYQKLAAVIEDGSGDYALSFIVRKNTRQWKNFLTKDFSSIFKLRHVLQEKVEVECKIVDQQGQMVFFDRFSVKPSLLFDFNYETNGLVEMKAERYSSDLIMNIIVENIPEPTANPGN